MREIAVLLLFSIPLAAQSAPAPQRRPEDLGSIQGKVVNALTREPLPKVRLNLHPVSSSSQLFTGSLAATTDAAGSFTFPNLDAGIYALSAQRNGFVAAQYGAPGGQAGTPITLAAGQKLNALSLELTPYAIISGRVVDENGDPMPNVSVSAVRRTWTGGQQRYLTGSNDVTDDRGEYRIFSLAPGAYYLSAEARTFSRAPNTVSRYHTDETYVPVYFPGVFELNAGTQLRAIGGAELQGINFTMKKLKTAHVRGRVVNQLPTRPTSIQVRMVSPKSTSPFGATTSASGPENEFDFRGVLPGTYDLSIMAPSTAASFMPSMTSSAPTKIEVGADSLDNVTLYLRPGIELSGDIVAEDAAGLDLSKLRVTLYPGGDSGIFSFALNSPSGTADEKGRFIIADVSAAGYTVGVIGLPQDSNYYLKAVQSGPNEVLETGLNVTSEPMAPIRLVVSAKGAQVSGSVADREGRPPSSATVVLVPEKQELQSDSHWYKNAATDQYGRFTIHGIPPGTYRAFAWTNVESGQWMDPDLRKASESKSKKLTLDESASETLTLEAQSGVSQ